MLANDSGWITGKSEIGVPPPENLAGEAATSFQDFTAKIR
jgi:hypothetical protein